MHSFKRSVVVSLVPLLCAIAALAQTAATPAKEDNLYSVALFASINQMQKSWGHINSGDRPDYSHMLVRKNPEITDHLPSQMGDRQVEYLDDRELIGRYKTLRKEFPVLQVRPMQSDGPRLTIQVTVYWVTSQKRNNLTFALSDWSDVEFRYDCEKQTFVVSSVKLGGI